MAVYTKVPEADTQLLIRLILPSISRWRPVKFDNFLDGPGTGELDQNGNPIVVPFSHASNAALSGSPQDGSDNLMLYAEVVGV